MSNTETDTNATDPVDKTIIRPDTDNYVKTHSASGSASLNNGDSVAKALDGATIDEVKVIAGNMGVDDVNKYDHLNVGQRRMNLGNRIRGIINKMEKDKEGSGDAKMTKASATVRKAVAKRADVAAKEAAKAEAEAAKKKEAKEKADEAKKEAAAKKAEAAKKVKEAKAAA